MCTRQFGVFGLLGRLTPQGVPRREGGGCCVYVSAAKSRTQKNSIDKHGDGFETQTHPNSQASAQEYDGTVDHRRNFDGFNDFLPSLLFFFSS